jgi:hypothetical protein
MDSILEQLKQSLESAVGGLSSEQMQWHAEGKWCVTEVLEHLYWRSPTRTATSRC